MASKSSKAAGETNGMRHQGLNLLKSKDSAKSTQKGSKLQPINGGKKVLPQIKKMTDRFNDMIAGCLDNLPCKPPSEVRIFLSSTFSDMRAERNALAKDAYPTIKEYCNNKLDLDFRVVDLRWGINASASDEHTAEKICLAEIENCQKLSLGPNFLTILSHRYGHRHIPPEIPMDEFDIIMAEVRELGANSTNKMTKWYHKDENNVPPIYVLQSLSSKKIRDQWDKESAALQVVLRQAVDRAHKKGLLQDAIRHKYYKSVTEEEIEKGILQAESPGAHTACFIRKLTNLTEECLSEKNATRYIDTVEKDNMLNLDEDVMALIANVQNVKIPSKLPTRKIHTYPVLWKDGGISPTDHDSHKCYIDNFCKEFTFEMLKMIEDAKHLRENQIPVSEYYTDFDELLHHMHFCNTKCEIFKGQDAMLSAVHQYLTNGKNRKPLIIHAKSGVGKTSVMAKIMSLLPRWFGLNCMRMIRFLGTSPESTDIYDVLFSVLGQLADHHDMILEPVGYRNTKSIIKYLPRFLRNVSRSTKEHIFILLDSIDQLNPTDNAYSMNWLPVELPLNVHIIVSMLPHTHNCLENTRSILKQDNNCFLELQTLPVNTSVKIINSYLTRHKRAFNDTEMLLKAISKDPTPLFLKLVLDQVLQWRSYETSHRIATSTKDAISFLFNDIEKKCGAVTQRVIGYLTYGLGGLTEVELEDVLSLDDKALDAVYVHHDPPVNGIIHIPSIVLTRILYMLREYLTERQSQGKKTTFWYHRQFIEYAQHRISPSLLHELHKNLAELYLAEDKIKRTITLTHRKKTLEDVDRQITLQPLTPKNKRKLQALPYHLAKEKKMDGLKKHCLFNLKFMMTKVKAFSLRMLLRDYQLDMRIPTPDDEINLLVRCLREMKENVSDSGLPLELISRLPNNTDKMPYVSTLLSDCRDVLKTSQMAALMPLYPCLDGSSLHQLCIPNVQGIISKSADGMKTIVKCSNPDFPEEEDQWKLIDFSAAKLHAIPGQFILPPMLAHDDNMVYTVESVAASTMLAFNLFNFDTPRVMACYEIPLNTSQSALTCIQADLKNVTFALEGLVVVSYDLSVKKLMAEKSSGKMYTVTEVNRFTLNLPSSGQMVIKAVYRIWLAGTRQIQFISLVVGQDGKPGIDSCVVISSIDKEGKKHETIIHVSGTILLDHVHISDTKGSNKQLMLSSFKAAENYYSVRTIDVVSGEVIEEHRFSDVVHGSGFLPSITLGQTMVVPTYAEEKCKFTTFGAYTSMVTIDKDVVPTCTIVTEKGVQIWCDTAGRIHIKELKPKKTKHGMATYRSFSLVDGVSVQSLLFCADLSLMVALTQSNELVSFLWNDICAKALNYVPVRMWRMLNEKDDETDEEAEKTLDSESFSMKMINNNKGIVDDEDHTIDDEDETEDDDDEVADIRYAWNEEDDDSEETRDEEIKSVDINTPGPKSSPTICLEHLVKHDQALSVLIAHDEKQVWTLDRDCKIRIWDLPSCMLSRVLGTIKEESMQQVAELTGSVHSNESEQDFCIVYFPNLKELFLLTDTKGNVFQRHTNIAAYCMDVGNSKLTEAKLYMLVKTSDTRYSLDVRAWPFTESYKNICIKDTVMGHSMSMRLSANRHHVVLAVECTTTELEIIIKTVIKNHMHYKDGSTKFYAIDIKNDLDTLAVCYRQLTKIPCVANCWAIFSDNFVVMGKGRTSVMWDISGGSCDQRMIKGTKTGIVYRPAWIEDDSDHMKICHGRTICMALSGCGTILAVGSEDGYVLAYTVPRGNSVLEHVGKKPNHGNAVEHVVISADGKWIASYCSSRILKIWNVTKKMRESASIGLSLDLIGFQFSENSKYLTVHGHKDNGQRRVFMFEVL